ncbi:MAG: SUMF1/EgtB/PvdO family nonheme iron enzyme [Bryobacteraceae bacterium]|nr:SUMF1/EgtB/PvdO family nonheme iron enzyme [Bryobacteraceae bacterium]
MRQKVIEASGNRQVPWSATSVVGTFVFRDLSEAKRKAEEEAARIEKELKDLEAKKQAAVGLEAQRQQEREAEAVRQRLRLQQLEQERLAAEEARRAELSKLKESLGRRTEEETRLAELRKRVERERIEVARATRAGMTLSQARAALAAVEAKIAEIRKPLEAEKAQALARLEGDYKALREAAARQLQRGEFETTAAFEARKGKAEQERQAVERKYEGERVALAARYDGVAKEQTRTLEAERDELSRGSYLADGLQVAFGQYDADKGKWRVVVNGEDYEMAIAPEAAQALSTRRSEARLEARSAVGAEGALMDPVLVDPAGGGRFALKPRVREAGETKVNPRDGLTYVWIPPGSFTMGFSAGDSGCDSDEKPAHRVTLSKGYWMGQTEVTQAAWTKVLGGNPSRFKGADLPVESVDWNQAQKYCKETGGRLPTEAEWEYAARAGSRGASYGELNDIAWYDSNSDSKTHAVKGKQPNGWGLYDMLGNVWEWVQDWHGSYSNSETTDPTGPSSGSMKGRRGGSWVIDSGYLRVSGRSNDPPGNRFDGIGFRCVREAIP